MVFLLSSVVVVAILVAVSRTRNAFGIFTSSGTAKNAFPIARERTEQSIVSGQVSQLLVVVLPDGKIVIPRVSDRF
jgi:hypothetical protein